MRRARGKITAEAVGALIEAVGTDLRELAASAAQLVADTGGTVDVEAVRRYHRGRAEASGFAVADKVVAGDRVGALEALRWALVLGVPPVLVADALADAVRTLAKVGSAGRGDPNRLAGMLGMPPWKIRKAQSQVRGWHPDALAVAIGGGGGGQRGRQGCGAGRGLRAGASGAAHVRGPGDPRLTRRAATPGPGHTETAPLAWSSAGLGGVGVRCVRPAQAAVLTRLAIADLRFAAWFLWMTPLLAALSRAFDAARCSSVAFSVSPASTASRNRRTAVRTDERTDLLRCRRFSFVLTRLIWDLMLATRMPRVLPAAVLLGDVAW